LIGLIVIKHIQKTIALLCVGIAISQKKIIS